MPTGDYCNPAYEWHCDPTRPGCGDMGPDDCKQLAEALGLTGSASHQGVSIPASSQHYQEYVDRANGRTPSVVGGQYWD